MISVLDKAIRIGVKAQSNSVDGILRDQLLTDYSAILYFPDEESFWDLTGVGQGIKSYQAGCALINKNCVKITSGDMFKFTDEDSGYSVNTITALEPDPRRRMAYYVYFGFFAQGLFSVLRSQNKIPGDAGFWAVTMSDQIAEAFVPGYREQGKITGLEMLKIGYACIVASIAGWRGELKSFTDKYKNLLEAIGDTGYSLRFTPDNSFEVETLPLYNEFKAASKRAGFLNVGGTDVLGLSPAETSSGYHEYLGFSAAYCKETPGYQKLPYFACFSPDFSIGPFNSPKLSGDGDVGYADFPFNSSFVLQNTSVYNTYPKFTVQAPVVNILNGGFFTITYPVIEEV